MEYFTEEDMARIEGYHRNNVVPNNEQLDRLIDHARELLRLKAEDGPAKMCNPVARPAADPAQSKLLDRPRRPEPRTFTNRVRESDFCTCTNDRAGQTEENMRREGFECVSSIPVVSQTGNIYVHMHFRRP